MHLPDKQYYCKRVADGLVTLRQAIRVSFPSKDISSWEINLQGIGCSEMRDDH